MEGQGVVLNGKYFEPEMFNLVSNPYIKKESICEMCEEEQGDMLTCDGVCQGTYHVSCLGLFKRPTGAFKCDACTTGRCDACTTGVKVLRVDCRLMPVRRLYDRI